MLCSQAQRAERSFCAGSRSCLSASLHSAVAAGPCCRMTPSVLCIAICSRSRIIHGPSWDEHAINGVAGRSMCAIFAIFADSCLPLHREVDEAIIFSLARITPANYAHKLTKPRPPGVAATKPPGVTVAAHRSLRGKRQSRQPPCRCEAGTPGGFAA